MDNENVINVGQKKTTDPQLEKVSKALDNPELAGMANKDSLLATMVDNEFGPQTDVVNLPSRGKFYLNKQAQVKVKSLTAEDENILTSPELIRSGKVLDVLLSNAIIDDTLTPEDMLVCDKNAVLLALRQEGYGNNYEVKMTCPSCSKEFQDFVPLSELETKELEAQFDEDGLFAVTLPKTKWVLKFKLLTGRDELLLSKKSEVYKKTKNNEKYQQFLTERYFLQIQQINGHTDKLVIKKAISNMPISDSLFLREYIREIEPGIDMNWHYTCKHCSHTFEDSVPITAKLFWPNAKI